MGQARDRGTFEERKAEAIAAGRKKKKGKRPRRDRLSDIFRETSPEAGLVAAVYAAARSRRLRERAETQNEED